jgi:Raf kinase inhibitor-like YbhB/YbcL family protein
MPQQSATTQPLNMIKNSNRGLNELPPNFHKSSLSAAMHYHAHEGELAYSFLALSKISFMKIISPLFTHGAPVPQKFTCLGANINPPLLIEDVPEQAKALVLIFEDADATPKAWTHWMLFDIPPTIKEITENEIPAGAKEGLANNHTFGYEGPCPKYFTGTHHYWFRLYALDTALGLPAATEREEIEQKMQPHIIATAMLSIVCTAQETVITE